MTEPTCTIIAGPNGAGKTTFALTYLREAIRCDHFINADLIAAGLSPLVPAKEAMAAGRIFLEEIKRVTTRRESFEHCQQRVRERVLSGGHDIPAGVIARRYSRSVQLLLAEYTRICDKTSCWDNSGDEPVCIFTQSDQTRTVFDARLYSQLTGHYSL
jgi:predicted ABC-type ATPase